MIHHKLIDGLRYREDGIPVICLSPDAPRSAIEATAEDFARRMERAAVFVFENLPVALDGEGELCFASGIAGIDPALLPDGYEAAPDGTIFEAAPARTALMQEIAARLASTRGAALAIDYGHLRPGFGDTLQAMLKHGYDDVFAHPGVADLTSHVDFAALEATARACGCHTATMTQGDFLLGMGLLDRAGRLGTGRDPAFQEKIRQDVERLAAPGQMGTLFKVLALGDRQTRLFPFGPPSEAP